MAVFSCDLRPAFSARDWVGCLEPDETGPRDPGVEDGHRIPATVQRLHPSHRPWIAILFARLPEDPTQARLQGIDERQGQLL